METIGTCKWHFFLLSSLHIPATPTKKEAPSLYQPQGPSNDYSIEKTLLLLSRFRSQPQADHCSPVGRNEALVIV